MNTIPKSTQKENRTKDSPRKAVLICPQSPDSCLLQNIVENRPSGTQLVGYLRTGHEQGPETNGLPCLGLIEGAHTVIEKFGITDILFTLSITNYIRIHKLITDLVNDSYNVWIIQTDKQQPSGSQSSAHQPNIPENDCSLKSLSPSQRTNKRIFDILLGSVLQILALPIMGIITLIIKLDSPGPVIFKQLRVGENGKLFQIYKFRTMIAGAEENFGDLMPYDQYGNISHKTPDDPRVTRFGRFLRKTSLDELPQFINVLEGDMSLVGPRPELPIIVTGYEPWQYNRFIVPQGVTGWWQVNGRSDKPMHLHTKDDIYYIRNYSFLLDLSIIARTIWVIVKGIGAY